MPLAGQSCSVADAAAWEIEAMIVGIGGSLGTVPCSKSSVSSEEISKTVNCLEEFANLWGEVVLIGHGVSKTMWHLNLYELKWLIVDAVE